MINNLNFLRRCMSIKVDQMMNNIENTLSQIAAYPIAGTLAGTAKVIIGITQSITALALGILTFIPATAKGDYSSISYSWTHIKHGLGNIAGGTFEAIPLLGTAMYFFRYLRQQRDSTLLVRLSTGYENKWMPYPSLVERDWSISGTNTMVVAEFKKKFNQNIEKEIKENDGLKPIFQMDQLEIAKKTLRSFAFTLTLTECIPLESEER